MEETKQVAVRDSQTVQRPEPTLLEVIQQAAMDPTVDVAKMSALVELKIKMDLHDMEKQRYNAAVEFAAAKKRVQARAPRIEQNGVVMNHKTQTVQSRYALLEDIDLILRPIMEEEGFSVSVGNVGTTGSTMRFVGRFTHDLGHSEELGLDLPRDESGGKNGTQGAVSTLAYARRALIKAFANVIEKGKDKNGESVDPITGDQAATIRDMITEADKKEKAFLIWLGAPSIESILARDFDKAMNALRLAIQAKREKGE